MSKIPELPKISTSPQPKPRTPKPAAPAIAESVTDLASEPVADISVIVPFVEPLGYAKNRLDVKLTSKQAKTLKGIVRGLEARGARLSSGRYVGSGVDAIRWLLDEMTVR